MKLKLAIIGLGQIGASLGMALGEGQNPVRRVGFDINLKIATQAKKHNAVDETVRYAEDAVADADAVIIALPLDAVCEMIELVAPAMKSGAILMDTAPVKSRIAEWVAAALPENCAYVGLTPSVAQQYLLSDQKGIEAARADLFRGGIIAISTSPQSNSKAIKLAADLVRLIEATPLFADIVELDGIMTATHVMPQFLGAALLNATVDQPGWREARKLAGRAYAEVSGPIAHFGDSASLTSIARLNQENTLRMLGSVIAALQALREDIQHDDYDALAERLERAYAGREQWWQERLEADWSAEDRPQLETPVAKSVFSDLLRFGGKPPRREE
ncbi:MAG: prephenate dehydrogenase [Chloroflexi bacterium]|jgi:prephenate dehydrogenase|nr:prephenate dehydrogenase [Chloroflexota bacterium]